jgi:broad specificity phosphatase PhoE
MMRAQFTIWPLVIFFFFLVSFADAQQAIFIVRHGETVAPKGSDYRPLSEAGQRRAGVLANLLKDAGISTILTSDAEWAVKTAEPLAKLLRIEPKALPQLNTQFKQKDIDEFASALRNEHRKDTLLVVAHSNSVPALLRSLGYSVEIKIPESEFDNLFVVVPGSESRPTVLRLRY